MYAFTQIKINNIVLKVDNDLFHLFQAGSHIRKVQHVGDFQLILHKKGKTSCSEDYR